MLNKKILSIFISFLSFVLLTYCIFLNLNIYNTIYGDNNSNNQYIKEENNKIKKDYKKVFAVIPHHNLFDDEIDSYYNSLKDKYGDFDNIVLISPNHFTNDDDFLLTSDSKYCFGKDKTECVNGKKFSFTKKDYLIYSFKLKEDYIETTEHGIGNHFYFLNKYFKDFSLYAILLKINTKLTSENTKLINNLINYDFDGDTLFIASVDSSHHVNDKVAVFHDMNTLDFLNSDLIVDNLEVDCPNCLQSIKYLANTNGYNYFDLYDRTSVDKKFQINSNYKNTSHIYGEFVKENNFISFDNAFSGSYKYLRFEDNKFISGSTNEVFSMFFGDLHFTRGFTYKNNDLGIKDYLSCFYSNNDTNKDPDYRHNRMFYSFDFVGANLETSIAESSECVKSNKSIVFRTKPEYLDYFKDIGINIFNLANNHSYDCGDLGFQATKRYLKEKGIYYFGDGRKDEENIYKTQIGNTKIVFMGFNDIGQQIDYEKKSEKIKKYYEEGYIVIVNIHWGCEYCLHSNKRQQEIARDFIDNGAKLIIGHHPHVVEEYEEYKGVPIIYSLGNFIFDQPFENTLTGYGVVFAINGTGVKYDILEFKRDPETYKIDCDSFK